MRNIVFGLLALFAVSTASAKTPDPKFLAQGPNFSVIIQPSVVCKSQKVQKVINEVFKQKGEKVTPDWKINKLFKAQVQVDGKNIPACAKDMGGAIVIVGEDGGGTMVSSMEFEPVTDI